MLQSERSNIEWLLNSSRNYDLPKKSLSLCKLVVSSINYITHDGEF